MYTMPMILPLDGSGQVYVLQDDQGQIVGTGSREVCETLMYLIGANLSPVKDSNPVVPRSNIRAAITI